jgi:glycerol-3-phosphate responsive antiterminator
MQLILAILLYLKVIVCPATYTQHQIDVYVDQNKDMINAVQKDEASMQVVRDQYYPKTDGIIIIQSEDD